MNDPFSSSRERHPALRELYAVPFDIYRPLVEGFLQDERYVNWSLGLKPWQLHCIGGAGCGKVCSPNF